jgi:glycosyltransferase involved in cell wall biosynthesis
MKIAQVVSTFPPQIGGMGQVCFEESVLLSKLGYQVEIFTPKYPDTNLNYEYNFKVNFLKPLLSSQNGGFINKVYKYLNNFDLVHLHYPFYGGAEFVWLASILKKQKYIVTYHMDAQTKGWLKLVQNTYDFTLTKKIFKGAKKIITIDKDHFNNCKFKKYINNDKVVEIFNGVDLKIFNNNINSFGEEKKTILFVGNLLSFKRFDLLLKSFVMINNKNVKIKVIGGGFEESKMKLLTKELGINNQVEFAGKISDRNKLAEEYKKAWCTVITSDCGESFSLAAVESLACGCPIVASDIPGVRGRVIDGENGFLFKSGSVYSLTTKLSKMLDLSLQDRKEMLFKCRQEAEQKYSWDRHVEKLIKIYQSIV